MKTRVKLKAIMQALRVIKVKSFHLSFASRVYVVVLGVSHKESRPLSCLTYMLIDVSLL